MKSKTCGGMPYKHQVQTTIEGRRTTRGETGKTSKAKPYFIGDTPRIWNRALDNIEELWVWRGKEIDKGILHITTNIKEKSTEKKKMQDRIVLQSWKTWSKMSSDKVRPAGKP